MKKCLVLLVITSVMLLLSSCFSQQNLDDGKNTPHGGCSADDSYINGAPLSDFSIVYSEEQGDYAMRAAKYIGDEIFARTGISLPCVTDATPQKEHEIVVGQTSRDISDRLRHAGPSSEFSVMSDGGSVALEGEYFVIAAAAYFFIDTYVPCDNFSAAIPERAVSHKPITKEAKNFVMLIGDGMGLYQTLLFDALENTAEYGDGEDIFYGYCLPYSGFASTRSLSGTTDSAASGTALSSGYKTVNGYIGQDGEHREVKLLTELAASIGKSTAVMSTESSTGATPAAFSAHADSRSDSDDIKADQSALEEKYGTVIKCGYNKYTKSGIEDIEGYVTHTLDLLDNDDDGFFLMYEEAYIDKHCHNGDMDNAFLALIRFNQVIARFMEYAYYHPETCVIITADHETGGLLPTGSGGYKYNREGHSSYYVPVFAFGDGMHLFDGVTVENVQIPKTLAAFMGVKDFGDQTCYPSLVE